MPVCKNREYRTINSLKDSTDEFIVEGYACTFDKPYVLFEYEDGTKVYEQIEKTAFDECDMSDVILQYDHQGKVMARLSNKTLFLKADEHGLHCVADLSLSAASKELYAEIKSGLITQMSFGFLIGEESYDRKTRTRTISKISKLFDVSAVSIPANADTSINARSFAEGVIGEERKEFAKRKALILKLKTKRSILL